MMRILFLAPAPPSDRRGGGALRMLHIVRFLADRFEVDLLTPAIEGMEDTVRLLRGHCTEIECVPTTSRSLLSRVTEVGPYWKDPGVENAIHRRLRRHSYGAVHVEKPAMLPYLPSDLQVPAILDTWAYGLTGPIRSLRYESGGLTRARNLIRLVRFGLFDAFRWPHTYCIVVVSEEDRRRCQRARPGCRLLVVPNGVDCAAVTPKAIGSSHDPVLLFTGDMSFEPNVDAALVLISQIIPQILRANPAAQLHLVGRDPDPRLRQAADDGIIVTGQVPDMLPYLHKARIYVAPLKTGAGTRTKLLEAMAAGLPIVTTTTGLEGIDAVPGRDVMIADEAEDMVAAIRTLLGDPGECRRLGQAARRLVVEQYDWKRCLAPLEELYRPLLDQRAIA
ncbi:MAG: glycosyltransferase [Nitrospiraceae bacterium]